MPKQSEIKQEELQEFWEWCGWHKESIKTRHLEVEGGKKHVRESSEAKWLRPRQDFEPTKLYTYYSFYFDLPPIDLNNLFKYAMDEVINDIMNDNENLYSDEAMWMIFDLWIQLMEWYDSTSALYQTIQLFRYALPSHTESKEGG